MSHHPGRQHQLEALRENPMGVKDSGHATTVDQKLIAEADTTQTMSL